MAKLISATYGDALFELAVEENKLSEMTQEIKNLQVILAQNPEFRQLLNHPHIDKEEKKEVVKNVFEGRTSGELQGFMTLIVEKDRFSEIDEILTYFLEEVNRAQGIGVVYVTTAVPMTDEQKKQTEEKLLSTTDYKQLEMNYDVDASLIGGMTIRIKDRIVDSSVRTKLYQLQKQLLDLQLD